MQEIRYSFVSVSVSAEYSLIPQRYHSEVVKVQKWLMTLICVLVARWHVVVAECNCLYNPSYTKCRAGVKCEVRGGKMRGTGARYQCEATGNLRGWNVRGATDNWRSRCRYGM